jgi:Tfp pilus assembly protein PilV
VLKETLMTALVLVIILLAVVTLAAGSYIGIQEARHIRAKAAMRREAADKLRAELVEKADWRAKAVERGHELDNMRRRSEEAEGSNGKLADVIQDKDREFLVVTGRESALRAELAELQRRYRTLETSNGVMAKRIENIHRESAPAQRCA